MPRMLLLVMCLFASAAVATAQNTAPQSPSPQASPVPTANPFSGYNKVAYAGVKDILLRTAEKVPEADYSFKPTPAVRSFGQILGHVADSQYYFCSTVLGEKNPAPHVEKTKTSKADLITALKEAFAYCDKAYAGMTDASGAQTVRLFGDQDAPKLSVLTVNSMHNMEHYGNLVTYMRLKNIIPPTSEQKPPTSEQKK